MSRKVQEALLSLLLERTYTKDQILELDPIRDRAERGQDAPILKAGSARQHDHAAEADEEIDLRLAFEVGHAIAHHHDGLGQQGGAEIDAAGIETQVLLDGADVLRHQPGRGCRVAPRRRPAPAPRGGR